MTAGKRLEITAVIACREQSQWRYNLLHISSSCPTATAASFAALKGIVGQGSDVLGCLAGLDRGTGV